MTPTEEFELLRTTCCKTIATWYIENSTQPLNNELKEKILQALLDNKTLKETGKLFLEKRIQYDSCSESFKQLFKLLGSTVPVLSTFPDSWLDIDLHREGLIVLARIKEMAPITLLNKANALKK
jgi:hypothetical protein